MTVKRLLESRLFFLKHYRQNTVRDTCMILETKPHGICAQVLAFPKCGLLFGCNIFGDFGPSADFNFLNKTNIVGKCARFFISLVIIDSRKIGFLIISANYFKEQRRPYSCHSNVLFRTQDTLYIHNC